MDETQQTHAQQQSDPRFLSVLDEVETITRKYVVEAKLQWYERRIRFPRIAFFLSGIRRLLQCKMSLPYQHLR